MTTVPTSPTAPPSLGHIEAFLADLLGGLAPDPSEPKPGRPKILPSLALWGGILVCVLRGLTSQLDLWRLLTVEGLWSYPQFPVSDQAIYNRLATAGTAPLERLFAQVRDLLLARLAPLAADTLAPFASGIYALDQTTLDPVARLLPALRPLPDGDDRLLPGQLDTLFDVRRQLFVDVRHTADPHQHETVVAPDLVASLPPGSLLLADLGYFGFRWFDDRTAAGHFWLSRLRSKIRYEVIHTFAADPSQDFFDGLIWLGAYRADKAKHAVRLVTFRQGTTTYRYITNVRDPRTFPPLAIAQVYARRWDIELAFKLIKRELGLHLLWSAKPIVILQQVWAVLIIAQILQAFRQEIATRAEVDLVEVSLPLLVQYVPRLLARGRDPLAVFVRDGRRAGFIRPSRRLRPQAPDLPETLGPLPSGIVLERAPRYAGRNPHGPPKRQSYNPYGN